MRALLLLLLLAGCATRAQEDAAMPKLDLPVTRTPGPDPTWDRAYDLILAKNGQNLARMGVTQLTLAPHTVDGRSLPHLVNLTYPGAAGPITTRTLVLDGALVPGTRDPARTSGALRAWGFPATPMPARLLADVLCYFSGTLPAGWCPAPSARLDGKVLTLEATRMPDDPGGGGAMIPIPHRLEITFDDQAGFTLRMTRQIAPDAAWTPVP
ncbi:MAG: hypothetical protein R3F60_33140 [bacterium]